LLEPLGFNAIFLINNFIIVVVFIVFVKLIG
jgi:hypothetical protein